MTHEILWFDNLVLLGFDTPRQESLNGVKFSPDMFSKVNIKGMQIVVHFFLQKIFGEEAIKESFKFCWPILDATQGKDFQKTAGSVLESLESQKFLPQGSFVRSHFQNCFGDRFITMLFYLSVIALECCLKREFPELTHSIPFLKLYSNSETAFPTILLDSGRSKQYSNQRTSERSPISSKMFVSNNPLTRVSLMRYSSLTVRSFFVKLERATKLEQKAKKHAETLTNFFRQVETDKTQLENDWRLQVQKYRSTYLRGYDARTVGSYAIRLLDDQLFLDSQQINEWLRALVISPTENKQSETSDFQNSLSISPRRTDPLLSVIGESHESLWTTKTVVGFDQAKQPPNFHSSQTNLVLDAELLRLNESLTFLLCEINGVAGGLRDGVPLSSLKSLVILWKEAERNAGEQLQGRDAQIVSVVSNLLRWHRNGVQTGNQINTDLHHAKQQLTRMIADLNRFELNSFYAVLEQAAQNNFRKARHTHTIIPATPLRQIVSLGTPQIQNRHYPR